MHPFLEWRARQVMTVNVKTVSPDMTLQDLEGLFDRYGFNAFPVVEQGVVIGFVTKFDLLKAFRFTMSAIVPHYNDLMMRKVSDVMSTEISYADPEEPVTRVLETMIAMKARSIPVLDGERRLLGIITREDLLRALQRATQAAEAG